MGLKIRLPLDLQKIAATPIVTPWRMALHRENPASTTPSLTPRHPNRPLKIAKLTPCKKPEVAGSAGHCEPGVGRFTDPHPFTCSFFTPYLHCLMFRQCRLPQPSPNPSSERRKIPFSIEGYPMPQIVAFAGPSGPAFSFSAFLLPARPLVCVDGAGFLSSRFAAVLDSFTTGSHGPNRAGLLLRWCRSPTSPSDRPRIATQGRVWFHRLFLLDFLGGNPASCRSRW